MTDNPAHILNRSVGEWALRSEYAYQKPFADVVLDVIFTSRSGETFAIPGFYDGDNTWRLRFNPNGAGRWAYRTFSRPADPHLTTVGSFEVRPRETRGFLQATPGRAWAFTINRASQPSS